MIKRKVAILGSTGSVGMQAADVCGRFGADVVFIAANKDIKTLEAQIRRFKPLYCAAADENAASLLKAAVSDTQTKVYSGYDSMCELTEQVECDIVYNAVSGKNGLMPTLAALQSGKTLALANKESMVCAGQIVNRVKKEHNAKILPVDSEHCAIFQCLQNGGKREVKRILLTASGGPFYKSNKNFKDITVKDALAHPTWKMGKKITIDSATLMNKGLEAIEASVLFDIPIDKIEIIIHPQSVVHSMVEFNDGCVMAQLSNPDMTLPIQYALSYPNRTNCYIKRLDLTEVAKLEFYKPDFKKFKCLNIAYKCAKIGGTMTAVMSAANEIAVRYFLDGKIRFDMIPAVVEKVINKHKTIKTKDISKYIKADLWARQQAENIIKNLI